MDDKLVFGEFEIQQFKQVSGPVWTDTETLGWIVISLNFVKAHNVSPSVDYVIVRYAMAAG